MTLIKSISGIRGTIGGEPYLNLTPPDIVRFSLSYAQWLKERRNSSRLLVVIGRDSRISGIMVKNLITGTLQGMGIDVLDLGLASTPTTEIAVGKLQADGGIIITASHNPAQWNALKLLNEKGEFLSAADGEKILELSENESIEFATYDQLGSYRHIKDMDDIHISEILDLKYVDIKAIRNKKFKIAIDCVNSVGGIIIPKLLHALGVEDIIEINCEPDGLFRHNPEPLPENLQEISSCVKDKGADLGFVVDPDVDRLAIINEDGSFFGEEYTLVAVADYILSLNPGGNTVSNLSSTQALKDITGKYGGKYSASAVGEVNVVREMKETNAIIGGEGNGGVILPELHYGRDALVGIALFLSYLAKNSLTCSEIKKKFPQYHMSKNKVELKKNIRVIDIIGHIRKKYRSFEINDTDGLKIIMPKEWIHLRSSNTEPIIRIYAESTDLKRANSLAESIVHEINSFTN